jgi:hypothetical protein
MDKHLSRSLKEVKSSLYRSGFFSKDFSRRIYAKLKKGKITFAIVLSTVKSLHVSNSKFSPVLNDFNSHIKQVKFDSDLDSASKEKEYVTIAAFCASFADKMFLDIHELLNEEKYEAASLEIDHFIEFCSGVLDSSLKSKLLRLKRYVNKNINVKVDTNKNPGFEKLSFDKIYSMNLNEKISHLKSIQSDLNSSNANELVPYLAMIQVSLDPNLKMRPEHKSISINVKGASLGHYARFNNTIKGNYNYNGKVYDFSFSFS